MHFVLWGPLFPWSWRMGKETTKCIGGLENAFCFVGPLIWWPWGMDIGMVALGDKQRNSWGLAN